MSNQATRLYRSRSDRMIAGVCGGLGGYFKIDPTWIRLLFASVCLLGFPGIILVYLIMIIVVPDEMLQEGVNPG